MLTIKLHHCLLDHRLELTWKMNSTFNKSSMIEKKRKRKRKHEKYSQVLYSDFSSELLKLNIEMERIHITFFCFLFL
jgi:hypothetical protein